MIKIDILNWIQDWYLQNCDGDWEHSQGINISTLDNPGWSVDIDLMDTNFEFRKFDIIDVNRSELDWIYCRIDDSVYKGDGGSKNLAEILLIFRNWIENTN